MHIMFYVFCLLIIKVFPGRWTRSGHKPFGWIVPPSDYSGAVFPKGRDQTGRKGNKTDEQEFCPQCGLHKRPRETNLRNYTWGQKHGVDSEIDHSQILNSNSLSMDQYYVYFVREFSALQPSSVAEIRQTSWKLEIDGIYKRLEEKDW